MNSTIATNSSFDIHSLADYLGDKHMGNYQSNAVYLFIDTSRKIAANGISLRLRLLEKESSH